MRTLIIHPFKPFERGLRNCLSKEMLALSHFFPGAELSDHSEALADYGRLIVIGHEQKPLPYELRTYKGEVLLFVGDPDYTLLHDHYWPRSKWADRLIVLTCYQHHNKLIEWLMFNKQIMHAADYGNWWLPKHAVYIPLWQYQAVQDALCQISTYPAIDVSYIGHNRSNFRNARLHYLLDTTLFSSCTYSATLKADNHANYKRCDASDVQYIMKQARATIVVGDGSYKYLGSLSQRMLQGWGNGVLTFVDTFLFDKQELTDAYPDLEPLFVSNPREIAEVLNMPKHYQTQLVQKQYSHLERLWLTTENIRF